MLLWYFIEIDAQKATVDPDERGEETDLSLLPMDKSKDDGDGDVSPKGKNRSVRL